MNINSPRFYVDKTLDGGEMDLRGDVAHRIARVLRLSAGATVELFDGGGRAWPAEVTEIRGQTVRLAVGQATEHAPDPTTILLAGMIRPHRFEWLIEKAAELGVTSILPVVCTRSAVRPAEIGRSRHERWRRIAVEAAEQCGRVTVPRIEQPVPFEAALDAAAGRFFVAAEPAHGPVRPLGAGLGDVGGDGVTLFVGPEGGLTPDEVRRSIDAGAAAVTLGPRILRAETAALAALSILVDARQRAVEQAP
ncbi:MAG: 16S rRNA (uracil(1498)-N(3))-methyltransferase [Dehalococcoidia bacterium]